MKKYAKEELFKMDAVDVYKLVIEGEHIKRFPNCFWQQPEALDNAVKCIKHLIEDILKLSDDELKEQLSTKVFHKNKLGGMLVSCFNNSPFEAINYAYPNKFKIWEFKQVSRGYWKCINHGIEATKWLIEEHLKFTDEELKEQLSRKTFVENGLDGMLTTCFNGSAYKALNALYPDKFKPWELKTMYMGIWYSNGCDIEEGAECVRWLVENKLKLADEDLKEQLSIRMFYENDIYELIMHCFDGSPYKAIDAAYPGKFKKEDFKFYNEILL